MKDCYHDIKMKQVYAKIYGDRYNFVEYEMKDARYLIIKNMSEIGVPVEQLKNINILNIGTGREAMVFHDLGAKNIYHLDISNLPVSILTKLKNEDSKYGNIYSRQLDICEIQDLRIDGGIDLVYLAGVLHHLYDPKTALDNIFKVLNPSAKIFFRIYRSGCLAFFVIDFIRKFINYEDRDMFDYVFKKKFKDNKMNRNFYMIMYDHFFVPVLKLYNPRELNDYFMGNKFSIYASQHFQDYDHDDIYSLSGEGVSLFYQKAKSGYDTLSMKTFPFHIDQMRDIRYKEGYINDTIGMMTQFLEKVERIDQERKVEIAIDLIRAVQIYRQANKFNEESGIGKKMVRMTARDIHGVIQERIKKVS